MVRGGEFLVWHLPSGRFAKSLAREHWVPEGLLEDPPASPATSNVAQNLRPAADRQTEASPAGGWLTLAFDPENRLVAACASGQNGQGVRLWHMDPARWETTFRALRPEIPRSFSWDYTFEPEPGKRQWELVNETTFHETYPSGRKTVFRVMETITVDHIVGTLVQIEGGNFQVFIPDKESARMHLKMRAGESQPWSHLGVMTEVR